MKEQEKEEIALRLRSYIRRQGSQARAAKAMGIGAATVSAVLKEDWVSVSEEMLRKIDSHTRVSSEWTLVETGVYREMTQVMDDARRDCDYTWVIGVPGCGKSCTAEDYARRHPSTYYVLCSLDMGKREFVEALSRAVGIYKPEYNLYHAMREVVDKIRTQESPLIILDEAEKLGNWFMSYFITLYNELEEMAGIVCLSSPQIKTRMQRGIACNRRGYEETYSRLGRRFYELDQTDVTDVTAICRANGVASEADIHKIIRSTEQCNLDIRRVRKLVRKVLHA